MRYTILKSAGIALIFGLCTISCNDFWMRNPHLIYFLMLIF